MSNVQTPATYFTAPLLDQTVQEIDVDISAQPYFYNNGGTPKYLAEVSDAIELIQVSSTNAHMSMGHVYDVPKEIMAQLTVIPVKHVDEVLRIALVLEEKDPLTLELGELKKGVHTEIKSKKPLGPTPKNLM